VPKRTACNGTPESLLFRSAKTDSQCTPEACHRAAPKWTTSYDGTTKACFPAAPKRTAHAHLRPAIGQRQKWTSHSSAAPPRQPHRDGHPWYLPSLLLSRTNQHTYQCPLEDLRYNVVVMLPDCCHFVFDSGVVAYMVSDGGILMDTDPMAGSLPTMTSLPKEEERPKGQKNLCRDLEQTHTECWHPLDTYSILYLNRELAEK
jgi:hypothetical protein